MYHGQSQMVKAATPLHKAMEYETPPEEMPPTKVAPSTPESLIYDGYLKLCKHFSTCSQIVLRFIGNLPSIKH